MYWKIFYLVMILLIVLIGCFGFLLPYLISSNSTELVFIGIGAMLFLLPPLVGLFIKIIVNTFKKGIEKNEKN